jgi:hypothetical protein
VILDLTIRGGMGGEEALRELRTLGVSIYQGKFLRIRKKMKGI